jgi:hypothetical protein
MTTVQVTYIDSFGQEVASLSPDGQLIGYLQGGPFFDNLSGLDQGTNFECAKLRTRAINGSLSEPVVLCGKTLHCSRFGEAPKSLAATRV